jgi:hypothetical protein
MAVLTKREVWVKPRPQNETRRISDLTPEEAAATRRALHVLRRRLGSWEALGEALRTKTTTLQGYGSKKAPSAAIAIRAARVAGVAIEEVLAGRWPVEGACPHCGRT